jgi:hypothetical protein
LQAMHFINQYPLGDLVPLGTGGKGELKKAETLKKNVSQG